jgi:hypothetical protein
MALWEQRLKTENGTNEKWRFPIVYCKQKTETANFRLLAANGNQKNGSMFSMVRKQ